MRYNIDPKIGRGQSTRMKVPDWAGRAKEMLPASSGTLLDQVSELGDDTLRVRGVSNTDEGAEFNPTGLMGSGIYDEPMTLDYSQLSNWARDTTPVEDEPDVTDWMVPAKAQVSHLKARAREYDRAGSSMVVTSGDPFVPGVNNGQLRFKSERGNTVSGAGEATVVAGDRETQIPAPGGSTVITPNTLGWATASDIQEKQWVGSIMSIEELTNNPSSPIAFPNIAGNTGPVFVGHNPSRPSILNRVTVGIQSDSDQTINFRLRDSQDYTNINAEFSQQVSKGSNVITFRLLALGINPMAAEIQPEDGTKAVLTDYTVFP